MGGKVDEFFMRVERVLIYSVHDEVSQALTELSDIWPAIAELIAADRLLDKTEAALEAHRDADNYTEGWGGTHLELFRTLDLAKKRRAAALANIGPKQ